MKKGAILLTSLIIAFVTGCQDHVFEPDPNNPPLEETAWDVGGPNLLIHDTHRDKEGNSYIVGYFRGSITFGTITLTGSDNQSDISSYLVKYSPSGEVLWAQKVAGNGFNSFYRVAVDNQGNVYAAGTISRSATIGETTINGQGFIVVKYSRQGEFQWIKMDELLDSDSQIVAITLDQSDNLYIAGIFRFGTTMVNGVRMTARTSDNPRITTSDFFIARLNTAGEYQWVKQVGGSGIDQALDMTTDKEGNFYITGMMEAEANRFGNIAKYDPNGNLQWITSLGMGTGQGQDVALDGSGNVYVNSNNGGLGYIGKVNNSGAVQWLHQINAADIAANAQGEVFITGSFTSTVNILGQTLTSSGGSDIYIAKLASDGTLKWSRRDGADFNESAYGITLSPAGNIYVTGSFSNTTTLAGQPLTSSEGNIFIARYKE